MKRIGLYGGSFDPIHIGHLLVAQTALEELHLDRLYFIPATQSPFKPGTTPTDSAVRARMLRLALAGKTAFEVDDQEIKRGGISYTINTVRNYKDRFPSSELFYLIGGDHVNQLQKWREATELARLLTFVVIPRPGESMTNFPSPFRGQYLKGFPIALSASQVRARVASGHPFADLVPRGVDEVIKEKRLYISNQAG